MSIIDIHESTLREAVIQSDIALVYFGAPWCPPCKAMTPVLYTLDKEHSEHIAILKVNCDESPQLASEYGIMSMPTVIVFNQGEPVDRLVGLRPIQVYRQAIARYLAI
ncbi:co-chaperone YbbN [Paenibacillus sp. YYML68]|uniref:thioredoxin family protein n=1 Tax=Paenibacillus sp. YYML68 TaxID=2909250 RepID=UPI002493CE60|nr:thioredoxin family protein [Paenibacillus sp. YYML68]